MTATEFNTCVSLYFDHFLKLFGFTIPAKFTHSGKLYDATYEKNNKSLSISYEPGDEYLEIMLFEKKGINYLTMTIDQKQKAFLI